MLPITHHTYYAHCIIRCNKKAEMIASMYDIDLMNALVAPSSGLITRDMRQIYMPPIELAMNAATSYQQ